MFLHQLGQDLVLFGKFGLKGTDFFLKPQLFGILTVVESFGAVFKESLLPAVKYRG